jgi:hypothetical protein
LSISSRQSMPGIGSPLSVAISGYLASRRDLARGLVSVRTAGQPI